MPLPGPSAPYYGFLWYGGQATQCSSSPGTRTNFPPTPVVSATCMPCPQSPGPQPADTNACSRMNFTLVPGDPRTLPHAQGFPLPSSSQLLPVSLPYTDLPGAQDFARLRTMGGLPSQPHPQQTAGLAAASVVARSGGDPLQVVQSLLATMQNSFLQQVKRLLGVTSPQLLIGPSVSSDMGQDVLRQPSPAGNQDASRAGPKSRS